MKRTGISFMITLMTGALLTACGQAPQMPVQLAQPQMIQQMNVAHAAQSSRQLLVRFKTEMDYTDSAEFSAKYGLHIRQYRSDLDAYIVDVDDSVMLQSTQIVRYLMADPLVAFAEVNHGIQVSPIVN